MWQVFFSEQYKNRLDIRLGVSPTLISTMNLPKIIKISKNIPAGSNLRAKIAQKLPERFNLRTQKKNLPGSEEGF